MLGLFLFTLPEKHIHTQYQNQLILMIKINSINPGHVSMFFKTKKLLQESCKYLNFRTISGCYRPLLFKSNYKITHSLINFIKQ